ncbi:ankyrin repeat protein [Acanthamoeba polyphaga mimivirus]|uniref:Ankyrin repeat protein n=4 Tax=Megamimivirinae TaxID=3044648 RepID=A0A2L2DJV2_MIMIV|nr:putative ankyrin repeat protein [Megavirus chiliensis]AFX92812.1 putative ankyrin repeat protein [Megavirus courdo11]AGD92667.1 putative ankyrin repeat protein [Megavirus lba]AVG46442.1 ankyrin repeat protein [Acanthamoeba polyphaga mimivirus]AEQ32952.1 ankyrin repeat protein [Megavirus chiliensis]AVG47555.1 ankyrin repeat protein [Acanthamoeba polyphaga mimivirus]
MYTKYKHKSIDFPDYKTIISEKYIYMPYISSNKLKEFEDFILQNDQIFVGYFDSHKMKSELFNYLVQKDNLEKILLLQNQDKYDILSHVDKIFKCAVIFKSYKILEYLIQMGFGMNYLDNYAIMACSSESKNSDFLEYIVENGGDICARNNLAIKIAARLGCLENFKYLMNNGADIHADNDFVIKILTNYSHNDILIYLYDNGINLSMYDVMHNYFRYCFIYGIHEGLELCFNLGLDIKIITESDIKSINILETSSETLKLLIDHGIDFSCLNHYEPEREYEKDLLNIYDLLVKNNIEPRAIMFNILENIGQKN